MRAGLPIRALGLILEPLPAWLRTPACIRILVLCLSTSPNRA
jgi:hypothetical protein